MINGNVTRQILKEELELLRVAIIKHHKDAGQMASGRTAKSMRVEVDEYHGTLFGRRAFGTLETGRRAGRVPNGFRKIIQKWMKDKGISVPPIPYKTDRPHKYTPQERGEMQFSFFVAKKIREEGTRLYRQGGIDTIYSNEIPETMKRIGDRLLQLFSLEYESIKLNKKEEI